MPLPPTRSQAASRLLTELNTTRLSLTGDEAGSEPRARLLGQIAEYALVSLVLLVIAGIEVGRWYFNTPPQPEWVCAFAAGLIAYAAARVWFILPQLRILSREAESRRLLKLALNHLCAKGYILFEGLVTPRGSLLGSVIVGPTGVFCLISRFVPRGGDLTEKIEHVSNTSLLIAGREIMADPLAQARRAASALYLMLADEGLDTVPVQPMVVLPGWTVERPVSFADPEVLVANEQSLEAEIRYASSAMEPKEVIAVSLFLEKSGRVDLPPDHVRP